MTTVPPFLTPGAADAGVLEIGSDVPVEIRPTDLDELRPVTDAIRSVFDGVGLDEADVGVRVDA